MSLQGPFKGLGHTVLKPQTFKQRNRIERCINVLKYFPRFSHSYG